MAKVHARSMPRNTARKLTAPVATKARRRAGVEATATVPDDATIDKWRLSRWNALDLDPADPPLGLDEIMQWPAVRSTWAKIRGRMLVDIERIDRGLAKGATFGEVAEMGKAAADLDALFGIVDDEEGAPRWDDGVSESLADGHKAIAARGGVTPAEQERADRTRWEMEQQRELSRRQKAKGEQIEAARDALVSLLAGEHPAAIGRTVAALLDVPTPRSSHTRGDLARGMALVFDEIAYARHKATQQAVEADRKGRKGARS